MCNLAQKLLGLDAGHINGPRRTEFSYGDPALAARHPIFQAKDFAPTPSATDAQSLNSLPIAIIPQRFVRAHGVNATFRESSRFGHICPDVVAGVMAR